MQHLLMLAILKIKEIAEKLGLIADYVVEEGTAGIWTYRKWNSGKVELVGRVEGSTKNVGTNYMYVTFPFYFQNTDYSVQITPSHNGTAVSKYADCGGGGNTQHGSGYLQFYYELTSSWNPIFNFRIDGRWK